MIIGSIVIVLLIVLYVFRGHLIAGFKKTSKTSEDQYDTDGKTLNMDKLLKIGDASPETTALQERILRDGGELKVDGIFGPITQSQLKKVTDENEITLNDYDSGDWVTVRTVVINDKGNGVLGVA